MFGAVIFGDYRIAIESCNDGEIIANPGKIIPHGGLEDMNIGSPKTPAVSRINTTDDRRSSIPDKSKIA
jgi:hypothetical protein